MDPFEALQTFEASYDQLVKARNKSEKAFVWVSEMPHPFFNCIMHIRSSHALQELSQYREEIPFPLSFWSHACNQADFSPADLPQHGWAPLVSCDLMHLSIQKEEVVSADIRPAHSHLDAFWQMTDESFQLEGRCADLYHNLLQTAVCEKYLLFFEQQLIGGVVLIESGSVGCVFNLVIHPSFQKQGHGQTLLRFLKNKAWERGLKSLLLLSEPAQFPFYEKLGFSLLLPMDIYHSKIPIL